jgi:hypothetical protein
MLCQMWHLLLAHGLRLGLLLLAFLTDCMGWQFHDHQLGLKAIGQPHVESAILNEMENGNCESDMVLAWVSVPSWLAMPSANSGLRSLAMALEVATPEGRNTCFS